MNFRDVLIPSVQEFINRHASENIHTLLLKHKEVDGVPMSRIADQIRGKKRSREKIPLLYHTPGIIYPPSINIEQSSSEETALFKIHHVLTDVKERLVCADLTGGFGIDSYFLSKIFNEIIYVEPNGDLLRLVEHNHHALGSKNIRYNHDSAEGFLNARAHELSIIYLDPSRRDDQNRKVVAFNDCTPDVTALLNKIFECTSYLVVKASPLMDIQVAISQLRYVKKVFVISVNNDCKELVFLCEREFTGEALIEASNIQNHVPDAWKFYFSEERNAEVTFGEPLAYLYEPNASILKAGSFKLIAHRFGLLKLSPNTHLYTSEFLVPDFPGRVFKIMGNLSSDKQNIKRLFPEGKANVTTRNFPLSVQGLKKMTGLKDGGEKFLIAFSGLKKKFLVAGERIS